MHLQNSRQEGYSTYFSLGMDRICGFVISGIPTVIILMTSPINRISKTSFPVSARILIGQISGIRMHTEFNKSRISLLDYAIP